MKKFLFCIFAALFLFSCSTVPKKTVGENENYNWNKEVFELNPQNKAFSAEGSVTMWIDVEQYKGKFNGEYQILSASPDKWRIIITGPFNISVATVIINGEISHIFHEGVWDTKPWKEISSQLFNAPVDGDIFSVMLGGRFYFDGECAETGENQKLCRKNGIYYKIFKGSITEIVSENLYIVYENKKWVGVSKGKHAFIFKNKKIDSSADVSDSLFKLPADEKDEFDEL